MKLEAVGTGFTYRWPGGEVRLEPGRLIDLPEERGQKLLAKAGARVRVVPPVDWAARWRDLAQVTAGLEQDDPRLTSILTALAECQRSHDAGNLEGFQRAAERVRKLMLFTPGSMVAWEGTVNHRLATLGPSPIECVHVSDGRLWVFVTWRDVGRWISDRAITTLEGPT